jgi:2-polyprenyl-6-methoxyphenol hydroxylase-like FAD-dependent oxidoreductase
MQDHERVGFQVTVVLEDGRKFEGDVLVGADGIRSKVWFPSFTPIIWRNVHTLHHTILWTRLKTSLHNLEKGVA